MPADFLDLAGRDVLVMGVANRRSVAWHVAQVLTDAGARVIYAVRSPERAESVRQMVGSDAVIITCDVQQPADIQRLATEVASVTDTLHGVVHSIAFADYSAGWLPFHETPRSAFLQAVDISCFSLVAVSNALSDLLDPDHGSVVTISISTTRMTAENYGYMAPVKAALGPCANRSPNQAWILWLLSMYRGSSVVSPRSRTAHADASRQASVISSGAICCSRVRRSGLCWDGGPGLAASSTAVTRRTPHRPFRWDPGQVGRQSS